MSALCFVLFCSVLSVSRVRRTWGVRDPGLDSTYCALTLNTAFPYEIKNFEVWRGKELRDALALATALYHARAVGDDRLTKKSRCAFKLICHFDYLIEPLTLFSYLFFLLLSVRRVVIETALSHSFLSLWKPTLLITGEGTAWYASGNRYEGQWRNGKSHGEGTYFYATGARYVCNGSLDQYCLSSVRPREQDLSSVLELF